LGLTPTPTSGLSMSRNAGARWFLTSENEWYKAAYYDATVAAYCEYSQFKCRATRESQGPAAASQSGRLMFE
jgi:hypothetical protein